MEHVQEIKKESNNAVSIIQEKSFKNVAQVDLYAVEAHRLIDEVLSKSTQNIESVNQPYNTVEWPTIGEFTIEKGFQKIEEFIKTWERGVSWLYYIQFLCEDVCKYSKCYRFKVLWSIPTRRKPIPRATVSVYFTIEASTIKPEHFPCEVYYVFETSKLVHRPGLSRFREKWLKDVVDSKSLLMETVTF